MLDVAILKKKYWLVCIRGKEELRNVICIFTVNVFLIYKISRDSKTRQLR